MLCYSSLSFYPKWQKSGSEATISWDVSGYYHYLPAIFIYHDLKKLQFQDSMLEKYRPTPNLQQSFRLPNDNMVMKYSCGQAIQMTPFFLIGHAYANTSNAYPSDGYSRPYQLSISIGALLIALIGLLFWRQWLLFHFTDLTVAIVILLIGLGSNYFEYAGITGAMTHNNLFMLYAVLLVFSHRYHVSPSYFKALIIGGCIGLMSLTRPTEIIAVLIPILYGMNMISSKFILSKMNFHKKHFLKLLLAVLFCGIIGSLQLIYWKYVSGDWLVYSYEDQGFSWLKPHIFSGLFSYNNGWLPYSPMMAISLLGLPFIFKFKKGNYTFILIYFLLFVYIAFAWDIWWYGGSLGQRTMVQLYVILSFPFAIVIAKVLEFKKWEKLILSILASVFMYLNLWFIYQAHGGGMLYVEQMTKAYYWKTIGTWDKRAEHVKLLDNKDFYGRDLGNTSSRQVQLDLPEETGSICFANGKILINKDCSYSPIITAGTIVKDKKWLRLSAKVSINQKEWNVWKMPQMILQYKNVRGEVVKSNMIRLHRLLEPNESKQVDLDSKIPNDLDEMNIEIIFWNADASVETKIDSINLIAF